MHLESWREFAKIIHPIILAFTLAWTVGVWLGERMARHVDGKGRPPCTVGGVMTLVLVAALFLALLSRDVSVILYAIVLIPPVAIHQYLTLPR